MSGRRSGTWARRDQSVSRRALQYLVLGRTRDLSFDYACTVLYILPGGSARVHGRRGWLRLQHLRRHAMSTHLMSRGKPLSCLHYRHRETHSPRVAVTLLVYCTLLADTLSGTSVAGHTDVDEFLACGGDRKSVV